MNNLKILACIASFCLCLCLFSLPAQGHALHVFAWLENDQILVQADFGQGRPANAAAITVYDSTDRKELAHGKTNAQGRFTFTVPAVIRQGHGLTIVANAGQGHAGEWTMDASELYAAASLTAGFDEAAIRARQEGLETPDHVHVQTIPSGNVAVTQAPTANGQTHNTSHEQIRNIVSEALELKLAPIRQEIAAQSSSGPTFGEIIGGIGWIIGLVGIGFYFKSRKR